MVSLGGQHPMPPHAKFHPWVFLNGNHPHPGGHEYRMTPVEVFDNTFHTIHYNKGAIP
jgi:hypothetical protein